MDLAAEVIEKLKEVDTKYEEKKNYSFTEEKNDSACLFPEENSTNYTLKGSSNEKEM